MNITITASDGKRFNGSDYEKLVQEVTAYETELELAKKKTEDKRKKLEEEKREREKAEMIEWEKVTGAVNYLNDVVDEYESKCSNKHIGFSTVNGRLRATKIGSRSFYNHFYDYFGF